MDATLGDLGRPLAVQLNRVAGDPEVAPVMAEFDPVPQALDSAILTQRVRAATVVLRRRLAGLVETQRRDEIRRVRQGRSLACRQLYRLRSRETGIFTKKTRRSAPDTAVYLLLDRSGSMAGMPLQVASEATLATALALEDISGCQTAVLAFPGSREDRVVPLLDFAERASPVAGRFRLTAQGTTPMASALWRAAYGLLCRPGTRRLLIVITDGEPDQPRAAEDIIHRCRQTGIEVYGLGIGLDGPVKALFGAPWAVSMTEIEALPAALFGVLERGLVAA
jgi:cobaltochelatase CobT